MVDSLESARTPEEVKATANPCMGQTAGKMNGGHSLCIEANAYKGVGVHQGRGGPQYIIRDCLAGVEGGRPLYPA